MNRESRENDTGLPGALGNQEQAWRAWRGPWRFVLLSLGVVALVLGVWRPWRDGKVSSEAGTLPAQKETASRVATLHGDWSVRVIELDEIRFCYVESDRITAPDGTEGTSSLPIQISWRSVRHGAPVARVLGGGSNYYAFVDSELFGRVETVDEFPVEEWGHDYSHLISALGRGEGAGSLLVLREDHLVDAEPVGIYSLSGFGKAYESAGRSCPQSERQPAAPAVVREPRVEIVDSVPPFVEISFNGPFFEEGTNERVAIRFAKGDTGLWEWGGIWEQEWADLEKSRRAELLAYGEHTFLSTGIDSREYYRNGELVYASSAYGRITWGGVCIDDRSGRLKAVERMWYGNSIVVADWNQEARIGLEEVESVPTAPDFDCSDGESLWEDGGAEFVPCRCGDSEYGYLPRVARLVGDLMALGAETTIEDGALGVLVERAERLAPFVEWDVWDRLDVERVESPSYSVIVITHETVPDYIFSFQYVLARHRAEEVWTLVFEAPTTRHYMEEASLGNFVDKRTVEVKKAGDWEFVDVGEWIREAGRRGAGGE